MEQKPLISFLEAKEAFLAQGRWRANTRRVVTSNLRDFTWKRNVDKISHADITDILDAIKGPSARAHALKDLRALFKWCIPKYLSVSPCTGIRAQWGKARERSSRMNFAQSGTRARAHSGLS